MGQYLYAVVRDDGEIAIQAAGLNDTQIFTVAQNGLVAVVSEFSEKRIRPERRHLSAHQSVLRVLLEQTTPLPMSFGVVSTGEAATRQLLKEYQGEFDEQLERVAGTVEMGLRVRWDVENIFEFFVARHEELAIFRDRIREQEPVSGPLHQTRIELGRTFEKILEGERAEVEEIVTEIITRACREINSAKPRAENDILNLSCMVERSRQDEFVSRVVEAASKFDSNYSFDYSGPWAPHHFVALDLSLSKALR